MLTLSLDTAGETAGVAILKDEKLIYESYLSTGLKHSETVMQLINSALQATSLSPADINLYAVSNGPGSFTGIRIGIAVVKGMCLADNTPCCAVSTLWSVANSCITKGVILAALDARRNEVYYAVFRRDENGLHRLTQDLADKAEIAMQQALSFGEKVTVIGDGANICIESTQNEQVEIYNKFYIQGRASAIAEIAEKLYKKGETTDAENIMPSYLRLSQAERVRKENLAKEKQINEGE